MLYETAIRSVRDGEEAYCKFLSANDTGLTGGHQSGFLVGKCGWNLLFPNGALPSDEPERIVKIVWNDGEHATESRFRYYGSKNELRITRFGRGFPYVHGDYCGALFILVRRDADSYEAFVLNDETDIENFLDIADISPTETNSIIGTPRLSKSEVITEFIKRMGASFPETSAMSRAAREIAEILFDHSEYIVTAPDRKIVEWIDIEYELFRALEEALYSGVVREGFSTVDKFLDLANEILNRRKSRAGKGIEHHLAAIFDGNSIQYTPQGRTEGNKRPDFIFPSIEAYHDPLFPESKLISLAAKRTCKDRWRQIINEADRLRNRPKYLFTLQKGNSPAQLREMRDEGVVLVVPKDSIGTYPPEFRDDILSLSQFIERVRQNV